MDSDKRLQQEISEYQNLAQENKNIDVTALMLNALNKQTENGNVVSSKAKKWAYWISVSVPPVGLFFAAYYYFSSEDDAKHVANICVILTIVCLAFIWMLGKTILSGSGTSLDQIQQIKPSDIQQLYQ
jgi:hypothetical protein